MRPLFVAVVMLLSFVSINAEDLGKADSEKNKTRNNQTAPENPSTRIEINVGNPPNAGSPQSQEQQLVAEPKPSPITRGDWLLAGITAIYVLISYFTFRAVRDSAERQLRAYVIAETSSIVNVADPILPHGVAPTEGSRKHPWGPVGGVHIINAGQTPAFKVRHWGSICLREYPLRSTLPEPEDVLMPSFSVLGPGVKSTKALTLNPQLTDEQVAELRATTAAIYFYGIITYEDVFKKIRTTRYRVFHNAFSGNVGLSTDFTFASEGNDAD
jgi:hypothetical protein